MKKDFPELMEIVNPFERFASRIERGIHQLNRPKTEIERFRKDLASAFDRIDAERVREVISGLLPKLSEVDIAEAFSSPPRPPGRRLRPLYEYLDDVEREAPFLAAFVQQGSFLPTAGVIEHWLTAQIRLRAAAKTRGEARSESLRSLADFLEVMYREMVTVLYEIECIRQGRQIHRGLDFGNIIETVAAWTRDTLGGFIDPEAAKIRNAAAHYGWEYDLNSERLHLYNRRRGEITWEARFTLRELYARLRGLYMAVEHFSLALFWRALSSSLELFRQPPLSRIFKPGVGVSQSAELEEMQAIALRFQPVNTMLATSQWTSRRQEYEAAMPPSTIS